MDLGTSNHMANHKEWFSTLDKSKNQGVVETGDDTPHPIEHIIDGPLIHVGQKGIMRNILHVPTITKNLVSIEQIVDQGMQFDLLISDASLKKKAGSPRTGAEKGGCSSSKQMT